MISKPNIFFTIIFLSLTYRISSDYLRDRSSLDNNLAEIEASCNGNNLTLEELSDCRSKLGSSFDDAMDLFLLHLPKVDRSEVEGIIQKMEIMDRKIDELVDQFDLKDVRSESSKSYMTARDRHNFERTAGRVGGIFTWIMIIVWAYSGLMALASMFVAA